MELYGRNSGRGRSYSDAQVEWGPPAGLTGLEESMMRLGMRSREAYPERPGVSDCVYYMRTGFCGYGTRCRYNHPRDRSGVAVAVRSGTVEYPERVGEPSCQFYLKTGTCKFGASCKFHHPKGGGSMNQVPLNFCGFPLRPGEKECSYYLKTGQCKFGVSCKFHHPQSASASTFYPAMQTPSIPPEQYGGTSASWRVARPPLLPGSYVQGPYGPLLVSPGVVPIPGWNPYSASVSPVMSPGAQPTVGAGSLYGITQLSLSSPALPGQYNLLSSSSGGGPSGSRWREQMFPERPGEPECQYYLKTGDCKFGSSCRYHHPREWIVPNTNCVLSQIGLPLRPGVQPCAFYLKQGHCKFGSSCKFDHPLIAMKYTPSASSCIDFAITSYPTGPSFLSGDLRPEFMPGSRKETLSTRALPFRGGSSSSPASLILSQTASLPLSEVQFSGQSPPPQLSSSSRSGRQGSEVHCSS